MSWTYAEEKTIIDNYNECTIQELRKFFPNKTTESIYAKIKRLRACGKIIGHKTEETVKRAYIQRTEEMEGYHD